MGGDIVLRLPRELLDRLRLGATVIASVVVLAPMGHLEPHPPVHRIASIGCMLALAVAYTLIFLRRRAMRAGVLLVPAMLVVIGTGLRDPLEITSAAMAAILVRTLYGETVPAMIQALLIGFVPMITVAIEPVSIDRHLAWNSSQVIAITPMILVSGVLNRALYSLVVRLQRAAAREAHLARMGGLLLSCPDVRQVYAVAADTATALRASTPSVDAVVVAVRWRDEFMVEMVIGDAEVRVGDPVPVDVVERVLSAAGEVALPGQRHWRAVALLGSGTHRLLLLGGRGSVRDGAVDAYRTLVVQMALAEADRKAREELVHQAMHDPLTGLPNREQLFGRVAKEVDGVAGTGAARGDTALMIVDLDNFKQINDRYGHGVGDALLVTVGKRIVSAAGEGALVARLGGDEFAVLLTGLQRPDDADRVAARVLGEIRVPISIGAVSVNVAVSVGIALATPSLGAVDLMRCADIAMCAAKARGKNRIERFAALDHGNLAAVRTMEEHLPHAPARGEIVVHYQPIIDQTSGRCVAVEALARWYHPELGALSPEVFIPIAERTGHISVLGRHVLEVACAEVVRWGTSSGAAAEPGLAGVRLAVNVSARQAADAEFASIVNAVLRRTGHPASALTLEITETQLIDEEAAGQQLREVAALGVRIAVDDFGTGYASIGMLRALPLHQIKIDRAFVVAPPQSAEAEILNLVAATGKALGLETVAEGVETPEQAAAVRRHGVTHVQGYLYAKPMPAEQFLAWYRTHRCERDVDVEWA